MKSFIFIVLIFSAQFTLADNLSNCNFKTAQYLDKLKDINEIKTIEIKVNDYRKWTKNTLEAFISRDSSITSKYKKKFSADLLVRYSFGECSHKAKVRLHGDWKDHINFETGGRLNQSIDISLLDGSIANIVKFKLLLPITRHHENAIILTKLLRISDFIAPRTSLVPVVVNGTKATMLFQEKASKELIESMNRREGPLFEGDERFLFNNYNIQTKESSHLDLENISLSKITNDNWASSSYISALISLNSFSKLQKTYMTYGRDYFDDYILDWKILSENDEELIEKWAMFEMFLFAANSSHALRPHNRKFYYNSLESGFEPIYFDGSPRYLDTKLIRQMPEFSKYPYLKSKHFKTLYQKIQSIRPEILANQMEGNLFKPSNERTNTIIENFLIKISRLHEAFKNFHSQNENIAIREQEPVSIKESLQNNIKKSIPSSHIINIEYLTSEKYPSYFPASICLVNHKSCQEYNLKIFEIGKMLERKKLTDLDLDAPLFIAPPLLNQNKTITQFFHDGAIEIQASIETVLSFNKQSKTLTIELLTLDDWALIKESYLNGIAIKLLSRIDFAEPKLSPARINQFGLTGCLTFYKSSFKKTKIQANTKYTHCEDIINIMNSTGDIQSLKIYNASADGLDVDFSNLNIKNVAIFDARNDCADFSQGNYKIESGIFKNCGDKGISVGEKSIFSAKDIKITMANVGISSKDSSTSAVNFLEITDAITCAEAFQKKQEFFGANLKISSLICNSKILNKDNNSFIQVL